MEEADVGAVFGHSFSLKDAYEDVAFALFLVMCAEPLNLTQSHSCRPDAGTSFKR